MALKSGARAPISTLAPWGPSSASRTAPAARLPTIAATRIHCLDISDLHRATTLEITNCLGWIGCAEHCGAGHEGVGTRLPCSRDGVRRDSTIHLQYRSCAALVQQATHPADLFRGLGYIGLPSVSRVDRHYQHQVEVVENLLDDADRSCGVERQSRQHAVLSCRRQVALH